MITKTKSDDLTSKVTIQVTVKEKVVEVDTISGFDLTFDMLNLGDTFSLIVPDPNQKWRDVLLPGLPIKIFLSNKSVNNGANTLMYTGVIVKRDRISDIARGSIIVVQCQDVGFYLLNNCPDVWDGLNYVSYLELFKNFAKDPTWGFIDSSGNPKITEDGDTSRLIRQGLVKGRAGQLQTLSLQRILCYWIQVEPGMTNGSILLGYAKNFGRLCNITPDGYFQVFTPNYTQKSSYSIHYHDDTQKVKNNILNARIHESIETVFTETTVVGERILNLLPDPGDPNTGKFRGHAENKSALPFTHKFSYTEGELYEPKYANVAAKWKQDRGLFDAFTAIYKVRGHQQGGKYYTPDTMIDVNDTINNIVGSYYVSLVRFERNDGGDITELHIKKPNLLVPVQITST